MLVRINNNHYINTEHISHIKPQKPQSSPNYYWIIFSNGQSVVVDTDTAYYVATMMQPDEGLYAASEPEAQSTTKQEPQRSLSSRIATFIKDRPNGVQLYDLQVRFDDGSHFAQDDLSIAINALLRENVIATDGIIYWHRANPPQPLPPIEETEF